jgi:hypothetical protein
MQFSDTDGPWQRIPQWAEFLVACGFMLGDAGLGRRRICVISMPCESSSAGLVALGAMRRRLTFDDANDSRSHFQRIEWLASQREVETFLHHETFGGRFHLESKDAQGRVWAQRGTRGTSIGWSRNGPLRIVILPSNASAWRFDGEAPTQAVRGAELPYTRFYEELIDGACAPVPSNLTQSDSGICLAGRVTGESASKSVVEAIRFQSNERVVDLARLLTVQRWSPGTISRVTFFNTRIGQLDRTTGSTRLVVADGDAAFLKVIESAHFRQNDVVGVIHRVIERDRLEAIGVKIENLAQWYTPDTELLNRMSPAPRGITISTLRRR